MAVGETEKRYLDSRQCNVDRSHFDSRRKLSAIPSGSINDDGCESIPASPGNVILSKIRPAINIFYIVRGDDT